MTMKSVDLPHLRSVVLTGHVGSGKTTLAEQLLFSAGAIPRLGQVDEGTAHLDFEPEEQKRRESLSLAVGTFERDGTRISLVDTPGYPDFIADVIEGFAAADGAVFVMDASGSVEAGLEQGVAHRPGDRDGRLLLHQQVGPRERGSHRRAGQAPGGVRQQDRPDPAGDRRGRDVQGLRGPGPQQGVRVGRQGRRSRSRSRPTWPTRSPVAATSSSKPPPRPTTTSSPSTSTARRSRTRSSRRACARASRSPCWRRSCSAAPIKGIGLRGLLDAIVRYLPSPADEAPAQATDKAGKTVEVAAAEDGPLLVRVFKTTADPFVGRLTYLRVLSGTLHSQAHVWNATQNADERIGQLLLLHGKEQEPIGELKAGEIGAIAKLTVTETGDTLCAQAAPLTLAPLDFPAPSLVVAIEPVSKGDLDKMGPALARMLEEEPTVRLERTSIGEQVLRTMGEAHTSVIIERLKRKFGAAIATHTPRVPYKETIRGKTQVHGRYKKQTGGHGMFGDVWLELEPNPEGGVVFAERVVGGAVPKGFFAGVEKGIREAAAEGVFAGLSALRHQGHALRRLVPPGRLERDGVQDRGVDGPQGRRPQRQAGAHGADHGGHDPRPRGVHGRGQPRSQRSARPRPRAWTRTAACRSSPPTSRRRSSSATPRSCAHSPTGAARSARSRTTTTTSRATSPRRSSRSTARNSRRAGGHGGH